MIELIEKECYKCDHQICTAECPVGAFKNTKGQKGIRWNSEICIGCGRCVRLIEPGNEYPCDGVRPIQSYRKIQRWIENNDNFAVSIGPGLEHYSNQIKMKQVVGAWHKLGAKKVIPASDAAPIATKGILGEIQKRWGEGERLLIDSRCAAIKNYVDLIRPELKEYMITADSTFYASGRLASSDIKNCHTVFLGPDIAYKKHLTLTNNSLVDVTITWAEFVALCQSNIIDLENCYGEFDQKLNNGWIPRPDDLRQGIEAAGIKFISLEYNSPKEIITYLKTLKPGNITGFVAVFLCGICGNGPGVYSKWDMEKKFSGVNRKGKQASNNKIRNENKSELKTNKNEKIQLKYKNRPIIEFGNKTLNHIHEYGFLIILNLAARRKMDTPPEGFAHKVKDLGDKTRGYSGIENLRKQLRNFNISYIVKSSGKVDNRIFLDVEPSAIHIDKSVMKFKSSHRDKLKNELEDFESDNYSSSERLKNFQSRLDRLFKIVERNEKIFEDAMRILNYKLESRFALKQLKEQYRSVAQHIKKRS